MKSFNNSNNLKNYYYIFVTPKIKMSSKFSKPAGFEEKKKLEDKDILT